MLAEIFILQLETSLRANNKDSTHAPKFVPFDWTPGPGAMFDVSRFAPNTPRDQTTPRWRIGRPGAMVSAAAMMAWASMP